MHMSPHRLSPTHAPRHTHTHTHTRKFACASACWPPRHRSQESSVYDTPQPRMQIERGLLQMSWYSWTVRYTRAERRRFDALFLENAIENNGVGRPNEPKWRSVNVVPDAGDRQPETAASKTTRTGSVRIRWMPRCTSQSFRQRRNLSSIVATEATNWYFNRGIYSGGISDWYFRKEWKIYLCIHCFYIWTSPFVAIFWERRNFDSLILA